MKIRKKKNDNWSMTFNGNYFDLGKQTKAVKLFSELLKLHKNYKVDKQMVRDRIAMGNYDIVFVRSRTAKRFFCEIWIGDKQIGSFWFSLSEKNIYKQAQYFSYKIPEKKELFEKIMVLYPMLDQNAVTNKDT